MTNGNEKGVGVTSAIRKRLQFEDESLWRRFSARRLEIIDNLKLSSRKASEQEAEISKVADTLRAEFQYGPEYYHEFEKLVRAAVQSVRRNRKRSTKTKRYLISGEEEERKRFKTNDDMQTFPIAELFIDNAFTNEADNLNTVPAPYYPDPLNDYDYQNQVFLSDISKLSLGLHDETAPSEQSKNNNSLALDMTRTSIEHMIQPRLPRSTRAPLISNMSLISLQERSQAVKSLLLNFMQRSRTCAESTVKRNEMIEDLGKSVLYSCIFFMLEKCFSASAKALKDYLRLKILQERWLAKFYRDLDPEVTENLHISDETALLSLYTLIGSIVKDFGFETIMLPVCECLHTGIVKENPLIGQHSNHFKSHEHRSYNNLGHRSRELTNELDCLATVSSKVKENEHPNLKKNKAVTLRFSSSVLRLTYPSKISSPPKLLEIVDSAKSAFNFPKDDTRIFNIRHITDGRVIKSDHEIENLFETQENIELEFLPQLPQAIPISEITSVVNNSNKDSRIILPLPFKKFAHNDEYNTYPKDWTYQLGSGGYLLPRSNTSPSAPTFQPLL